MSGFSKSDSIVTSASSLSRSTPVFVMSVGVGYFVFGEVPGAEFALGAALVICAALFVVLRPGSASGRGTR